MPQRTRIVDVASAAGVSVATVSLALSGGGRMSDETRERVRAIAAAMNYAPNRLASSLRSQRSRLIGLLSDEIATTPFAGRVVLGAQDAAAELGMLLLVANSNGRPEVEADQLRQLLAHQVDGLIYAKMFHQHALPPKGLGKTPMVMVDVVTPGSDVPTIVPDEVQIGRMATERLIEAGHRNIAFLNGGSSTPATRGRLQGYQDALKHAGIPWDPALVHIGQATTSGGREACLAALSVAHPPTAVFCFNDQMAMGAYQAASERGLRIPTDLSVIGVDNLELISGALSPGLTTVALPHYEMGRWAVMQLDELIRGSGAQADGLTELACQLIERESVGAPSR
ncbi:MAG: LacI family DNA-binding transcriptional regulator [Agromyces sp.]